MTVSLHLGHLQQAFAQPDAQKGPDSFLTLKAGTLIRQPLRPAQATRRTKLWELGGSLHCSIIGTCLTTSELRRIVGKLNLAPAGSNEHDLHRAGVSAASRHDGPGKLLHKALDQAHRLTIRQFDRAPDEDAVRALWKAAVARGEIPGAYWAALTHPATSNTLVREVFGEVHMLSHLVGAANRADIRRLAELEAERAEMADKLVRQQAQLRDALSTRDTTIRELNALLAARIAAQQAEPQGERGALPVIGGHDALVQLVASLERRLGAESRRRAAVENRLAHAQADLKEQHAARAEAEARADTLAGDLAAAERCAVVSSPDVCSSAVSLEGVCLLYVGGRPDQAPHLRAHAERRGSTLLHHDGGIEDRGGLLAGQVSRADLVLFPVDCISHDAALAVKRLCRQAGKPFLPLRSAGLGTFLAALDGLDPASLRAGCSPAHAPSTKP